MRVEWMECTNVETYSFYCRMSKVTIMLVSLITTHNEQISILPKKHKIDTPDTCICKCFHLNLYHAHENREFVRQLLNHMKNKSFILSRNCINYFLQYWARLKENIYQSTIHCYYSKQRYFLCYRDEKKYD